MIDNDKDNRKEVVKIPQSVIDKYGVSLTNDEYVLINTPQYSINVVYDKSFVVSCNETTVTLQNSKVNITLWKNVYLMHTTIY